MSQNPHRVAIIGTGVSGLAAALRLCSADTERPISVTLYESRRQAGGRTRSYIDSETGDTLDNGQHLLMGCYSATLEYLRTIRTEHLLNKQDSLAVRFMLPNEGRSSDLKLPPGLPVPLHLLAGILRSDLLHSYEKLAAIRFGLGMMMFRYDKRMGEKSCADLFRFAHQPTTLIEKLWEPIVVGTMNLPTEKASAQVFLHTMRMIFLQSRKFSAFWFPQVGLTDLLIAPALDYIEKNNGSVRYGQRILSVQSGNNLVYLQTEQEREVFDSLIFAGDYNHTDFLPEAIRLIIPRVTYSPIVNAYLWLDKPIIGLPICGFIGTSLQWCFTKPTHFSAELIACTMSAAENLIDMENDQITQLFWNDLARSFPGHGASLLRSVVIKERSATPLLDAELQSVRPKAKTSIPNIFLAGDLIQNGLPMTIEGAVRNGNSAAGKVLERLAS